MKEPSKKVSIHASAREATFNRIWRARKRQSFNPRLRTGGDRRGHSGRHADGRVSIHASAREATIQSRLYVSHAAVSIHASAREATGGN